MTTGIEIRDAGDRQGPAPNGGPEAASVPSTSPIEDAVRPGPRPPRCPVGGPARHTGRRHHRRGGRVVRLPPPDRRRARGGQDRPGPGAGHRAGRRTVPGAGTPRPAPVRHHRGDGLRSGHRQMGVPARPGIRQRGPPRRDEPDPAPHPVGPSRVDGGAAGVRRRRVVAVAAAAPGHRDAEPPRAGGHLPTGREPARPLRPLDVHRLPRRRRRDPPRPAQRWPLRPRHHGARGGHRPVGTGHRLHRTGPRGPRGRRVRRRPHPGHPFDGVRPAGSQSPRRHLAAAVCAGPRRPVGPSLRDPRRRAGRGRGVPVPPAHRRGDRRRGCAAGRPRHRRHPRTPT